MKTERTRPEGGVSRESGERDRFEPAPACELEADTIVGGKYRVKSVLGRGGFAVVYDAEHLGLGRDVALKVLHRSAGTPHVLIERFLREVRISALVRHPNVLEVYDAGMHDDGSPFLAMEKINGLSLHQQLALRQRLSVEETHALARQLLSALVAIGERGIIHRDIKPENLMVSFSADGALQLKLVDFGIALVQEPRFATRLTQQGALVGTPHYMAPEQLRCELADVRVDLYAVGVVLYQALTGAMPYDGADISSLTLNVLNGKARSLRALCPECPPSLARLVERALARDPERRFQDARSMLGALEATYLRGTSRAGLLVRARSLAQELRPARLRPQELMVAAATVALMALFTSHSDVAEAWRGSSNRSAPAGLEQVNASVAPLPLIDEARLAPAAPAEAAIDSTPVVSAPAEAATSAVAETGEASARTQISSRPVLSEAVQRARALQKKGLSLYLHAELDAAYSAFRQATLLAPNEAAAFRGLGLSAGRLGRGHEAQRALTRYLELAPDAADARLIRARLAELISAEATRGLRAGEG